jgi:proteasome lid subunit RPN8/RPN11
MTSITLGFIPGGSANGLVKSILDHAKEDYNVENAAFVVGKGRQMNMNLTEIVAE